MVARDHQGYAESCATADASACCRTCTPPTSPGPRQPAQGRGQEKLNYYGFSYGTYLGQVYATLFPEQVGRFVWDGVLNAKNAFYEANLDQNIQFDKNMDVYWKYLADNDAAFGLGTDWQAIKTGYYQLLDELEATPAAGGQLAPTSWVT